MASHQPSLGSSALAAAWALGDSPVRIRIAFSALALSSPQVSYANRAPCSSPPRFMANGDGSAKKRVAGGMKSVMAGCWGTVAAAQCKQDDGGGAWAAGKHGRPA